MILLLLACSDNNFAEISLDAIATSMGDFDDVSQVLLGQEIGSAPFNGYIAQATWDTTDDRPSREDPGETVEQLLQASDDLGKLEILKYNAIFVNSGTRGLGATVYNDVTVADDAILLDDFMLGNVKDFVNTGGTLVVSDWSYEIIEWIWPDAIEFVGDDLVPDAAQLGRAGSVSATIKNQDAADALGAVVNVEFDYSAWAIMEGVGGDTEVLVAGDAQYQPDPSQDYQTLTGVPLAVRFTHGTGQVVYSSFPWLPQTPAVSQGLLLNVVAGLEPGAGSQSAEAAGG